MWLEVLLGVLEELFEEDFVELVELEVLLGAVEEFLDKGLEVEDLKVVTEGLEVETEKEDDDFVLNGLVKVMEEDVDVVDKDDDGFELDGLVDDWEVDCELSDDVDVDVKETDDEVELDGFVLVGEVEAPVSVPVEVPDEESLVLLVTEASCTEFRYDIILEAVEVVLMELADVVGVPPVCVLRVGLAE